MVVQAVVVTAETIAVGVPALASSVVGAVTATSTPVLVGIVVGGAAGLLLFE